MRVAFIDGKVIMWPRGKTIDDVVVIGEQEGGLYKLKEYPEQAMVHDIVEPSELWHRRLAHVQAKLLKVFQKSNQNMMGSARDVRKERIQRRHFQVARSRKRNIGNHPLQCMWTNVIKHTKQVCILCFFH